MAYDQTLGKRIRNLDLTEGLIEKPMFGGVAWFLNGNFVVGIYKTNLIARVGADAAPACLQRPHARVMDITGRAMRVGSWLNQADSSRKMT